MNITLHAMQYIRPDGTRISRPWVWAPNHGWNHFYPELIDSDLPITTLSQFYHVMAEYDPIITIDHTPKTVLAEYQMPSTAVRRAFLAELHPILSTLSPTLIHHFPHRTLLLIGDFAGRCEWMAQQFEAMGWTVKRCATDLYERPQCDYYLLDHVPHAYVKSQYQFSQELYPMAKILNYAQADHILVSQNDLSLDFKHYKPNKVHYYAHKGAWPRLPFNTDITCFFHAYFGAPNQYKNAHRYLMNRVQHKELIPYVWNDVKYPYAATKRPIFLGFMGSYGSNPDPHDVETMDYVTVKLRHLRNEIVPFARHRCNLQVEKKGTEEEYVAYMHTVNLALNVSSEFGWTTERQYHAMGMGCVLVQNYYAGLAQLGFQDRVNCLLYQNKYDLEEVIDWARCNPARVEEIREAGRALAARNTWQPRIQAMMEAMIRYE